MTSHISRFRGMVLTHLRPKHSQPICKRQLLGCFESCDAACDCSLGDRTAGPCCKLPTLFQHQTTQPRPSPCAAAPASHSCASEVLPSPSGRRTGLGLIMGPPHQMGCTRHAALCPVMHAIPVQGPTALTLDFVDVARRMKLLGFNGVRLPFSFIDLYTRTPVDRTLVSSQLGISSHALRRILHAALWCNSGR